MCRKDLPRKEWKAGVPPCPLQVKEWPFSRTVFFYPTQPRLLCAEIDISFTCSINCITAMCAWWGRHHLWRVLHARIISLLCHKSWLLNRCRFGQWCGAVVLVFCSIGELMLQVWNVNGYAWRKSRAPWVAFKWAVKKKKTLSARDICTWQAVLEWWCGCEWVSRVLLSTFSTLMGNGHCTVRLCGSNIHAYNPGSSVQKGIRHSVTLLLLPWSKSVWGNMHRKYHSWTAHFYMRSIPWRKNLCSLVRYMECPFAGRGCNCS